MPRFSDALNRTAEEIQRPKPLPIGHYVLQVTKHPEQRASQDNLYEWLTFNCVVVSPSEDVDPDMLAEFGKVAGVPVRKEFMFSTDDEDKNRFEQTLNNVKQFLEHLGVDISVGTMKEWLPQAVNARFLCEITHRPDKNDPEVVYIQAGRTAAA